MRECHLLCVLNDVKCNIRGLLCSTLPSFVRRDLGISRENVKRIDGQRIEPGTEQEAEILTAKFYEKFFISQITAVSWQQSLGNVIGIKKMCTLYRADSSDSRE
jgi:hypothetical protein